MSSGYGKQVLKKKLCHIGGGDKPDGFDPSACQACRDIDQFLAEPDEEKILDATRETSAPRGARLGGLRVFFIGLEERWPNIRLVRKTNMPCNAKDKKRQSRKNQQPKNSKPQTTPATPTPPRTPRTLRLLRPPLVPHCALCLLAPASPASPESPPLARARRSRPRRRPRCCPCLRPRLHPRRRYGVVVCESTAKRRRSDGEATAKRRRSDERSDGFRFQIDSKHSKRGQKSMRKKGRSRLALLAPPLRCCRAALLLLACPRRQPLPSRQPLRQARRRRLRALVALALAFVDALQSPSLIFDLSVLKTICDARRGTTSPLLSLPFGCWVLGGRRLVLGLLHLPLRPSEACPAPRAPTTSIAAHAGHQHSCSSCGRNVTFLSSAQMKKKSSRMMMNRIMHADEL